MAQIPTFPLIVRREPHVFFSNVFKSTAVVDQARKNTLIDMEASGLSHQKSLSTRDFKEKRATFVPVADLESPEYYEMRGHLRIPIPEPTVSYRDSRVRIGSNFTG